VAIQVTQQGNSSRIAIEGEMTIFTAAEIKQALLDALSSSDELTADLSSVGEADTAGLQLLLMAYNEAVNAGKALHFVQPSAAVQEILQLSDLVRLLDGSQPSFSAPVFTLKA